MHIQINPLMRSALDLTIARRAREFRGVFSAETVARYVEESFVQVGGQLTVGPNFLPVMIERFFRERLWAVARSQGKVEKAPPEVCPGYPGKRYRDWPVGDRAGRPLEVVRRNRYELYRPVWKLLEALTPRASQ